MDVYQSIVLNQDDEESIHLNIVKFAKIELKRLPGVPLSCSCISFTILTLYCGDILYSPFNSVNPFDKFAHYWNHSKSLPWVVYEILGAAISIVVY